MMQRSIDDASFTGVTRASSEDVTAGPNGSRLCNLQ